MKPMENIKRMLQKIKDAFSAASQKTHKNKSAKIKTRDEYLEVMKRLLDNEKNQYHASFDLLWRDFNPERALKQLDKMIKSAEYSEPVEEIIAEETKHLAIAWLAGHYKIMNHIWIQLGIIGYNMELHRLFTISLFDRSEVLVDAMGIYTLYIICKYPKSNKIRKRITIDPKKLYYTSAESSVLFGNLEECINIYFVAQAFVAGFDNYLKAYYALGATMGMPLDLLEKAQRDIDAL